MAERRSGQLPVAMLAQGSCPDLLSAMGIDLKAGGRVKNTARKKSLSTNPHIALLIKLYKFLSRRTTAKFNKVILKRLMMVRRLRGPISLKIIKNAKDGKIAVVTGTVTDDLRVMEVPKMRVCALKFTETARARIVKAGGECLTFDQLALAAPLGQGTILLRAPQKARTAQKYMGKAPGVPNSDTRPRIRSTGRKFEMARGRRKSRGYKN